MENESKNHSEVGGVCFLSVNGEYVKEYGLQDAKIGDTFALEVVKVENGEVKLNFVRIKESEKNAEKVAFVEIFGDTLDGGLKTIRPVKISDIPFAENVIISKGVLFAGIDFSLFKGRDLSVVKEERYWKIIGLYSN